MDAAMTSSSNKKNKPLIFGHNICKCRRIFKTLSRTGSDRNFHLTTTMLLHYLVKSEAIILSTVLQSIHCRHFMFRISNFTWQCSNAVNVRQKFVSVTGMTTSY